MKATVACVGIRQPDWAKAAVDDYLRRFPKDFEVVIKAVKPESRTGASPQKIKSEEAARLEAVCPKDAYVVVMDERGQTLTSAAFAAWIAKKATDYRDIAFVIGGADGLDEAFKARAQASIRLSDMTLPHALARVFLVEQLYRAWSILAKHPYHRE
ncbi:MAG TPA: 23S rRNA (pseudouridine(1915)-N(3))-methyltransferase RlmH [Sutterella sp.]|nr:23S rRNA (pseudouridine(1915)-N(3))-methyltransferase RlmH [Sutterella sp.]